MEQRNLPDCFYKKFRSQITTQTRRESNQEVCRDKKNRMILDQLAYGPATAREVAIALHAQGLTLTEERNETAPRLTEMMQKGIVEVCGKRKDSKTGRKAAIYKIVEV